MKNDCVAQTAIDSPTLANISIYLDKCGFQIRGTSDLIRTGLQEFVRLLIVNEVVEDISVENAQQVLKSFALNPSGRNLKNRTLNLDGLDSMSIKNRRNSIQQSSIHHKMTQNNTTQKSIDDEVRKLVEIERSSDNNDNDIVVESLNDANSRRISELDSQKSEMGRLIKNK